jgi:RNA polymerase sigma factor (sigma-70 family)
MSAARQGSDDAVGELVTEFSPLLWHVARAAGLSSGDAEDVLQTVWIRLLEHLDEIRTPAALGGWLVVTAKREAWRVRAAERKQIPTDTDSFAGLPDEGSGSEERAILDDQRRTLWAAIRQLSPRCQELLRIIAFVPQADYAAVAAKLGMRIGSIGPTRGRCLAKLRAVLVEGNRL